VLFDLGNTLVYQQPYEPFQKILQANGIVKSIEEIRGGFEKGNKEFDVEKHLGLSSHEFYVQWNMTILKHLGITHSARKLAEEIDRQWFNYSKIYVYPEVKDSLRRLKQTGLKLGVVTRGYELDLEEILPRAGLKEFFDVRVGADTMGKGKEKRKPHPEAFRYALKQLGVKPQQAIYVGDDFRIDYLGAKDAGMISLLIKREGSFGSAARTIKRLDEIFEVLEEVSP